MPEYIERGELLEDIAESVVHTVRVGYPSPEVRGANKVIDRIKSAPVADVVEVKHGEWVNVQDFGGGKCFADCSICGTQEKAPNPTALKMFRRYCHYCGAKMDKKEGAEE